MKITIETTNCMNDLLADSRHNVSKGFLQEARSKDLKLIDENVVLFSHQEVSTVAAPFVVDRNELVKNQSLIFFYLKGTTEIKLKDGFYTIQGNLDKDRINEKSLLLLNSEGKVVQELSINQEEDRGDHVVNEKGDLEITDAHYDKEISGNEVTVSGKYRGISFEVTIELE